MRTRSQPDSPGGFVSLDDNKRATRRTARSTRSASRAASQEPTSEQPAEPATQPATRSKTQARTTKKSTAKKATSTASAAKPQTRKSSRRGTRSTARKTEHDAAEEPQETIDKNTHDTERTNNGENVEVGTEDRESGPSASNSVLMEPKNSERFPGAQNVQRPQDAQEPQKFADIEVGRDCQVENILNYTASQFQRLLKISRNFPNPSCGSGDGYIEWRDEAFNKALDEFNFHLSDETNAEINRVLGIDRAIRESTKSQAVTNAMEQVAVKFHSQTVVQHAATHAISIATNISDRAAAPVSAKSTADSTDISEEVATAILTLLLPDNIIDIFGQVPAAVLTPATDNFANTSEQVVAAVPTPLPSDNTATTQTASHPQNTKRPHTEDSSDDNAEPVTPHKNKRRNLGPPGSTPFARRTTRLTPLRRLPHTVSFSERKRRREAESQGRIHSTIFRLPQYVAQTEADRRASETAALSSLSTEPLQADFNFPSEPAQTDDQTAAEEPTAAQEASAQEPSTPGSARSSWNLSGLINSVPRSFSRLLPRFGRSRSMSEAPATQEPVSERIQRTQQAEASLAAATEQGSQPRRRLSEQPSAKRARNLSYSLFPAPIDRSRYLGDIPPKPNATTQATVAAPDSAAQPVGESTPQSAESQTSSTSTERGRETTPQASIVASELKKKRKRSPSPDVIPNPAGSSYGMDLDYFCYSSESDGEAEPSPPRSKPSDRGKTAVRSIAQSERPASKKVRFDASPEDTPSKRRARATDPYHGRHFIGMGGPQTSSTPTTPTPDARVVDPRQQSGFIPNTSGTFQLDYDALSDDSDTDTETVPPPKLPTPSAVRTPTSAQPNSSQSAQSPAPRSAARSTQHPSTPSTKIDEEALARARSQAEKYKPKTPSGLRTASRYSSPLTAVTPDLTPAPAPPVEKATEKFGDDEFAKDAQWLYGICPSGDLSQLVWPEKKPFGEGLNVSAEALRVANEIWDPAEVDEAYAIFQREFAEFKKTLA
ncbi:hypothetical protein BDV10DRAFT_185347 [Aspergillus recurvatus]